MGDNNHSAYTRYDNYNDGLNWKTILRDFLIFAGIVIVFMALTPHQKDAPTVDQNAQTVQYLPNGEGVITQIMQDCSLTTSGASGTKHYVMYDSIASESGTTRWTCDITGSFSIQGDTCTVISDQVKFTSYNSTFYKVDQSVTQEGNTIRCKLTVGKRFFYIPFTQETFEFTLTCNPDGTFS